MLFLTLKIIAAVRITAIIICKNISLTHIHKDAARRHNLLLIAHRHTHQPRPPQSCRIAFALQVLDEACLPTTLIFGESVVIPVKLMEQLLADCGAGCYLRHVGMVGRLDAAVGAEKTRGAEAGCHQRRLRMPAKPVPPKQNQKWQNHHQIEKRILEEEYQLIKCG